MNTLEGTKEETMAMGELPVKDGELTVSQEAAKLPEQEGKTGEGSSAIKEEDKEKYREIYEDILTHLQEFAPQELLMGKITEEHITEYLETNRKERIQQYRERREKRFINMLEIFAVLAAIVFIVRYLADDPTVLVNLLYIIGGLGALYIWKFVNHKKD